MLSDVIDALVCPHCGHAVSQTATSLRCVTGHVFDVARQGYVSLLRQDARPGTGDRAVMVAARAAFLAGGHYASIVEAVAAAAAAATPAQGTDCDGGCVVDLGAGTGYYLAAVLDRLPGRAGLALDVSKHAARRAARAHPRVGAVVCDTWQPLPVRSGAAALLLNVFAPRNPAEIRRILRPDGALVVAVATPRHLRELVPALGLLSVDSRKRQRLDDALLPSFTQVGDAVHEYEIPLRHDDLDAVAAMGPSAWHTDSGTRQARVRALSEPYSTTVSVRVAVYRPSL